MTALLCFNLFNTPHESRNRELNAVFESTLKLDKIHIHVVVDPKVDTSSFRMDHVKFIDHPTGRPTYRFWLNHISENCPVEAKVAIICNSDIYIPQETIDLLVSEPPSINTCYALTRYDVLGLSLDDQKKAIFFQKHHRDSQDTWVFPSPLVKESHQKGLVDFHLGVWGCDNRFAHEMANNCGFKVTNPSLDLKTYHLHNVTIPRKSHKEEHIDPPYLLVPSCKLVRRRVE